MIHSCLVCVWNICTDEKLPVYSNVYECYCVQGAAGNVIVLQPTKTAMTFCDIDPGRWIDLPALLQFPGVARGENPENRNLSFSSTSFSTLFAWYFYSHGKRLSREPWKQQQPYYLRSGFIYVRHFRKTFNFLALFIEEIYFRSLF